MVSSHPEGKGTFLAMKMALKNAGVSKEDINIIIAHATSTEVGYLSETRAFKNLFGPHAYQVSITANKSIFGHMLGVAGGVEAKVYKGGSSPPTINLEQPDPHCDLDYVPMLVVILS
jgi:3-oxoacyl-[acyl-carrier-protein] synthase II